MFSHFLNTYFRHSNDKGRCSAQRKMQRSKAGPQKMLPQKAGSF